MLNDNSVGDTWNTVTFVETYLGKKGACGHKKNPLPFPGYNFWKDIGGKDYGRTATAASSCVSILRWIVIDQDSAVFYEWVRAGCSVRTEDPEGFSVR